MIDKDEQASAFIAGVFLGLIITLIVLLLIS